LPPTPSARRSWRGAEFAVPNEDLHAIARVIDIPIVVTVSSSKTDVGQRIRSGADIINVAAGRNTAELVARIRAQYHAFPLWLRAARRTSRF
jgi:hypothetical protein